MKKGTALSMEVIVAATLALVVLIVLVLLFNGKVSLFARQAKDCVTMGGVCVIPSECGPLGRAPYDCGDDKVCCINQCLQQGGQCVVPCEGDECNGKCMKGQTRLYTFGCNDGKVCCKGG